MTIFFAPIFSAFFSTSCTVCEHSYDASDIGARTYIPRLVLADIGEEADNLVALLFVCSQYTEQCENTSGGAAVPMSPVIVSVAFY